MILVRVQARHSTRRLFPWRAIVAGLPHPCGEPLATTMDAWRAGEADLRREPHRNSTVYDVMSCLDRAGYLFCRKVRSVIEAALGEVRRKLSLCQLGDEGAVS
jgi:hypothetical protein